MDMTLSFSSLSFSRTQSTSFAFSLLSKQINRQSKLIKMDESDSQSLSDKYMVNSRSDDYDDSQDGETTENEQSDSGHSSRPLREQDRYLPIANIARIMKRSIPRSGKIAKDAKECIQECVSEFISFITSEASDRCHQEKRKTINGEDIIYSMSCLGFDNYIEPLKIYLQKYREMMPKIKPDSELSYDLYDSKGGGEET